MPIFDQRKAEALLPFRRIGTDYSIKLEKDAKGKEEEVP